MSARSLSARPAMALMFAFGIAIAITFQFMDFARGGDAGEVQVARPEPVDDSMHHFMEYVFEPNYKRLKDGMATEPKDKDDWKAIKGDSLTLAEGANLLLLRVPDEDAKAWRTQSVAVRRYGGELYQAARKSDYAAARKAYLTMLDSCNACHNRFADGKHQLKP